MERCLLLVDDEENITSALFRLLRRDGYNILRAKGGQEGLEILAKNQVGVIISDQRMPGMTGTEFFTKVKDLYPDTVRIVLSGYTELNSVTDAINRGSVYKFFTKPWEDDLLRANVDEAFQRYGMKIENKRLSQELLQANDELKRINLDLGLNVESKAREVAQNLKILQVSQEMLEVLPVAVIGIDPDKLIVIANQMAQLFFSENEAATSLLGEAAETFIPADLLQWAMSGLHRPYQVAKIFYVAGRNARCWCRSLGELSNSKGVLLVIDSG